MSVCVVCKIFVFGNCLAASCHHMLCTKSFNITAELALLVVLVVVVGVSSHAGQWCVACRLCHQMGRLWSPVPVMRRYVSGMSSAKPDRQR